MSGNRELQSLSGNTGETTMLAPLPEKPTARDIIARSILLHPSLFAEALQNRETEDRRYAASRDGRTRQAAEASARAYQRAREFAGRDDLPIEERAACICAETGPAVVALNVACKLQCLPPHVRTAAAISLDETPLQSIIGRI
jgi:hypothetical protein